MSKTLRFAFIGCGLISEAHAVSIEAVENAKLVAICDRSKEAMDKFCKRRPVDQYTDVDKLLERDDIDVVCILTPSALHSEYGVKAARKKKHILIEKPIDISYKNALALVEAAEENGVRLGVISQHRYDEGVVALKKALDAGELGQLNFGGSHTKWYREPYYYESAPWRGTWADNGGGALICQSIHYIDLLLYLMGDVDEVYAYCATRAHDIEVEDVAAATVKFKSGALGLIEGNVAAYPGFCTRLDIFGSDGGVIIEDDKIRDWRLRSGKTYEDYKTPEIETAKTVAPEEREDFGGVWVLDTTAHKIQYKDFVDSILHDREPLVNGREGLRPLKLILAIYESSRTGKPVKMDEFCR